MEFSAISLPPEQPQCHNFVIVEAAEGMLGMLTGINDGHNDGGPYRLVYSILTNNQWHSQNVIPLPEKYGVILFGVAGGYVLMQTYTTSSPEKLWSSCSAKAPVVVNYMLASHDYYVHQLYEAM
ncbi:hypothetical protein TRIUR3_19645 [Triticum urartu]|uniref:Uncharacterized protein n=1 Tax=Triticum urartu TaxID=4572 RepID=M7ZWU0_TRIUA|nr:hypothetical protein TRIUR3_19645 [Triticum urartu]